MYRTKSFLILLIAIHLPFYLFTQGNFKKPQIIFLDQCPTPEKITPPATNSLSFAKQINNRLKPEKLKPPAITVFPLGLAQGNCNFTNYTTQDGLALDAITCAITDKRGNIWFGTAGGGVSCYDGKKFENYTTSHGLSSNAIWCMVEDRKGNIWFGTNGGGVTCYDGRSFTNFTTKQGLAHNIVTSIAEDKEGNLWFGTNGGISRFKENVFENFTTKQGLPNNTILSIAEDRKGNLWFGSFGAGVSRFMNGKFTTFSQELSDTIVNCITVDKKGNIWFGTHKGISMYDGTSFKNFNDTTTKGKPVNGINTIFEDTKGNMWFGTNFEGASCYNGKTFINYTIEQGLSNNSIYCIVEDKERNIWFGTTGGGAIRYNGSAFVNYTKKQGLANNIVTSILEDKKKNIWFGTINNGVSYFDRESFTNYTYTQGLAGNFIPCIAEDKIGGYWFGTYGGGVSYYDGKIFINYTTAHGLAGNAIKCIKQDKIGNIWIGTESNGVSYYNRNKFINYTKEQGLASNFILSIFEDKAGNIWLGTDGSGVSKFNGKSFTNFATENGLASNVIYSICEDLKGNLWFGTSNGVSILTNETLFTNLTTQHGLPDNTITQIVQHPNGKIYLGTNLGICELAFEKNIWRVNKVFNTLTGYPIKDVNACQNTMLVDHDGIIWIGTGSDKTGLVRFDPSAFYENNKPPTVIIKNININEEKICWYLFPSQNYDSTIKSQQEIIAFGKKLSDEEKDSIQLKFGKIKFEGISPFYPLPQNLTLPYDNNNVNFEFQGIETNRNFMVRYQYILEGYDKGWSPITQKNTATFGNIHEGRYTFILKARSPEGIWSEPVIYTFTVLPPWYRTWWMYSFYTILAISTVIFITWWNGRLLRNRAKHLAQEVKKATTIISEQKKQVEEKNKDILDSIHYAKRIQDALLKEEEYVSLHLPEHFVLFIPKDIVSGDFYWSVEKGGYWYLAVADCTGHGVPGAFMSMLGMSFLNEIINNKFPTPAEILNELRDKVVRELGQTGKIHDSKDGMDISLIQLHLQTYELQWAGANNSINLILEGALKEIKGDKQPIGYYPAKKPFTNHKIMLQKGEIFYLLSDGYADQFGGPKRKKFKYKQLEDILLNNHLLSMEEQKLVLKNKFMEWKDEAEQTDDVCIIGVKI